MKLTSQEEYGLRCILTLAQPITGQDGNGRPAREARAASSASILDDRRNPADGGRPALTVGQIAEREGISTEYAGKLMGVLVRAGLVESVRGRYGGYRLRRPPQEITIAEALGALGGKLYDGETCDRFTGDHTLCVHTSGCTIRSVWSGLQQIIDQVLTRTTLWDLVHQTERSMREHIRDRSTATAPFEVGDPAGAGSGRIPAANQEG